MHVLGSRDLGGADRFFIRLVEALTRRGQPTLAVTRRGSPVARSLDPMVEQVHLPLASKWDLYSRWQLRRLLERYRPDVVQTYMGRATRLTHVPAGSRTVHVARLGGYYKLRGYYEHADAWVGNTQGIRDWLVQQGLPGERVFYIGNFVPPPRAVAPQELAQLREALALPAGAPVVFALGRLIEKKGFHDLLRAFAAVPAAIDGVAPVLVIAGDGSAREMLQRLAEELHVSDRVRWAGWQDDPVPFYALADLLVCPSRHEPLGNVILEAWTNRLPVVSTRNEGARELVCDGENALLAPVGDPPALAAAIVRALAMTQEARQRLAESGFQSVQREHGEDAVVQAYLVLYRKLSEERRLRARDA